MPDVKGAPLMSFDMKMKRLANLITWPVNLVRLLKEDGPLQTQKEITSLFTKQMREAFNLKLLISLFLLRTPTKLPRLRHHFIVYMKSIKPKLRLPLLRIK